MRIAFTGAGGTGKGTVSEMLCEKLEDMLQPHALLKSPNEAITKMIVPGCKDYKDMNKLAYLAKQFGILSAQIWQEDMHTAFVAERSVLDYLCYLGPGWAEESGLGQDAISLCQNYQGLIIERLMRKPYDYVFYMAPDFHPADIEKNAWKERTEAARHATDFNIRNDIARLEEMKCPTKFVELKGAPDERLDRIVQVIKANKRKIRNFEEIPLWPDMPAA